MGGTCSSRNGMVQVVSPRNNNLNDGKRLTYSPSEKIRRGVRSMVKGTRNGGSNRDLQSNTLTTPGNYASDNSKPTGSVFDLFGVDTSELLEETKNASVLGTLKSPPDQHCETLGLRWGYAADKGEVRPNMEDRYIVHKNVGSDDRLETSWLFGILDGHGGHGSNKAVDYVAENFPTYLYKNPNILLDPLVALYDTFTYTDSKLLASLEMDAMTETQIDQCGSTGIFLLASGNKFYIAHVGDSAIILSEKGKARTLLVPHKPTDPDEMCRIEKAGGTVVDGRVMSALAVSRAFGDYHFKTSRTGFKKKFNGDLVIAVPDAMELKVSATQEFVVLTSDGILSIMNPQHIVNFVKERLLLHSNVQQAAYELVTKAAKELRCKDNVSAVVVVFHQWGRPLVSGRYSVPRNSSKLLVNPSVPVRVSNGSDPLKKKSSAATPRVVLISGIRNRGMLDLEDYMIQERKTKIQSEFWGLSPTAVTTAEGIGPKFHSTRDVRESQI